MMVWNYRTCHGPSAISRVSLFFGARHASRSERIISLPGDLGR